ncbi:BMP family ABC transporter substrate-binding protein [Streptomyces tateyamensis]|uniref:BMP family ABC transporter substrate-binding protein n=1 Tax=Streptomyces tateyamensis TaxID=565073 RepID=UPI000DA136A2|nr:BMP family ABC transporter substrate-binding protein [Streptomyces tateyamensis]
MQTTAAQSSKNVQQVIQPADTAAKAAPYLAGLVSQHCDLVVTIGPAFDQAAGAVASGSAATRFSIVGPVATGSPANVESVRADDAPTVVSQQVATLQHRPGS